MKTKYYLIISFLLFILFIPGLTTANATSLTISKTQAGNVVTILSDIFVTDTPRNTVSQLKLYNHTSLIDTFTYGTDQNIPSNILTRLTGELTETVDSISYFIVNATVNHIVYTTFTNNYQATTGNNWVGKVWVEKFTGLTPGDTIKTLAVNASTAAGNVRVKVYKDDLNSTESFNTHNYIGSHPAFGSSNLWVEKFTSLGSGSHITAVTLNVTAWAGNVRVKVYQDDGTLYRANQTHPYEAVGSFGFNGKVWVEKFTGLTPGLNVTHVGYKAYSIGATNVRMKVYQDNGASGGPSTLLGESGSVSVCPDVGECNIPVTATVPASGNVWAGFEEQVDNVGFKKTTGLTSGTAKTVVHAFGTGPSPFGAITNQTEAPWLQIFYQKTISGYPGTLLGQSGSVALNTNGLVRFPVTATVPASGNVWAGFEVSPAGAELQKKTGLASGSAVNITRAYGAGPDPFGLGSNQTEAPWLRVVTGTNETGLPNTLLGQSGSTAISYNGINDIPLNLVVPANGKVWAGFEASSNTLELKKSTGLTTGTARTTTHTYGLGPDPFGTITNQTEAPWLQLTFNPVSTPSIITSNNLTVSPAYIPAYTFNCGIHCSPKLVNYTVTRAENFSKLYLTVNVLPIPFDIECKIINGTFMQHYVWSNFTQVNLYNQSFNVPYNDNVLGACFGSGQLLSFLSHGNQTALQTSASVFDVSLGSMIGVPTGVFFLVLAGMLANQRTGPIWVVILLAMIGIMGLVPFFTLNAGIWGLCVITGMLGLLVGRKIF